MTIRTFWNILLKILGIYLVVQGVGVIMQFLSVFTMVTTAEESVYYIAITLGTLILYFFVLWLFVFKTSWLIDKLDLEIGFEEEERIELKGDFQAVMSIAIIVIGGIMLADALPLLCKYIYSFYQNKKMLCTTSENPVTSWIILCIAKAILGYLLMTNSKPIVAFISRKSAKSEGDKVTK